MDSAIAMQEKVYTVDEIAQALRVHRNTVQNWIYSGELTAIQIGQRGYRVTQTDLDDFIQRRRTKGKRKSD